MSDVKCPCCGAPAEPFNKNPKPKGVIGWSLLDMGYRYVPPTPDLAAALRDERVTAQHNFDFATQCQYRAERAEAALRERDAQVARLREALERYSLVENEDGVALCGQCESIVVVFGHAQDCPVALALAATPAPPALTVERLADLIDDHAPQMRGNPDGRYAVVCNCDHWSDRQEQAWSEHAAAAILANLAEPGA